MQLSTAKQGTLQGDFDTDGRDKTPAARRSPSVLAMSASAHLVQVNRMQIDHFQFRISLKKSHRKKKIIIRLAYAYSVEC